MFKLSKKNKIISYLLLLSLLVSVFTCSICTIKTYADTSYGSWITDEEWQGVHAGSMGEPEEREDGDADELEFDAVKGILSVMFKGIINVVYDLIAGDKNSWLASVAKTILGKSVEHWNVTYMFLPPDMYTFYFSDGNPYGTMAAIGYTLIRGIVYALMAVMLAFIFCKAAWFGNTGRERSQLKSDVASFVLMFGGLTLAPQILDIAIYIRDMILSFVISNSTISSMLTTDLWTDRSLYDAIQSPSANSVIFLVGCNILRFYFVIMYISIAFTTALMFVILPIVMILSIRDKTLLSGFLKQIIGSLLTPVIDVLLFLACMMIPPEHPYIQLFACFSIIPSRGILRQLLGLGAGQRSEMLGMGALAAGLALGKAAISAATGTVAGLASAAGDLSKAKEESALAEAEGEVKDGDGMSIGKFGHIDGKNNKTKNGEKDVYSKQPSGGVEDIRTSVSKPKDSKSEDTNNSNNSIKPTHNLVKDLVNKVSGTGAAGVSSANSKGDDSTTATQRVMPMSGALNGSSLTESLSGGISGRAIEEPQTIATGDEIKNENSSGISERELNAFNSSAEEKIENYDSSILRGTHINPSDEGLPIDRRQNLQQKEKLAKELDKALTDLNEAKSDKEKIESAINLNNSELNDKLLEKDSEISRNNEAIQAHRSDITNERLNIADEENKIKSEEAYIAQNKADARANLIDANEANRLNDDAQSRINVARQNISASNARIAGLENQISELNSSNASLNREKSDLKRDYNQMNNNLKSDGNYNQILSNISQIQSDINSGQQQLNEAIEMEKSFAHGSKGIMQNQYSTVADYDKAQRVAEVKKKFTTIQNFDMPGYAENLSHSERANFYKQRAEQTALQSIGRGVGSVRGAVIGAGAGAFLGAPQYAAMGAAAGMGIGGTVGSSQAQVGANIVKAAIPHLQPTNIRQMDVSFSGYSGGTGSIPPTVKPAPVVPATTPVNIPISPAQGMVDYSGFAYPEYGDVYSLMESNQMNLDYDIKDLVFQLQNVRGQEALVKSQTLSFIRKAQGLGLDELQIKRILDDQENKLGLDLSKYI